MGEGLRTADDPDVELCTISGGYFRTAKVLGVAATHPA